MTILYSDVEPLSKYSPVTLHPSPATEFLMAPLMKVPYSFPIKGDQDQSSPSSHKQAWQGTKGSLMTGLKVVKKSVNHL